LAKTVLVPMAVSRGRLYQEELGEVLSLLEKGLGCSLA